MKINNNKKTPAHKNGDKNVENSRGYTDKIARTRAVNQPRMLKEYQMNAMVMYYGPEV